MERPKLCPDETCRILWNSYWGNSVEKGASWSCYGKLQNPQWFKFKETEHQNPYSYCECTPLKGVIRFFFSVGDAQHQLLGAQKILQDAHPLECKECGKINNHPGETFIIFDDEKYCSLCALRLGKIKWYEENKKYW